MNAETKELLDSADLPGHVISLLHLYGIASIKDLVDFGETEIQEIQALIRGGTFGGQTDFTQKSNRKKFLDGELCDYSSFSFRPVDRKKLLKLAEIAKPAVDRKDVLAGKRNREALGHGRNTKEQEISQENSQNATAPSSSVIVSDEVSESVISEVISDDSIDDAVPLKKRKVKPEVEPELDIAQKSAVYLSKTISVLNEYWAMTSFAGKVEDSHVKVSYDGKKKALVVKANCLLCDEIITLSKTDYSVSASNYKSHIARKHIGKLEDGNKDKQMTLKDLIGRKQKKDGRAAGLAENSTPLDLTEETTLEDKADRCDGKADHCD